MIDTALMQDYIRQANPIPDVDDVDSDELAVFVAAAQTRRAGVIQVKTQYPAAATPAHSSPQQWRHRAWAFAMAFAVIAIAIGVAVIALRGDAGSVTEEPSQTTLAPSPTQLSVESLEWARLPVQEPGECCSDVTVGGPGLVAVGLSRPDTLDPPGDIYVPTVWTSPDGYDWSQVLYGDAPFGVDVEMDTVIAGGPGLVAVGGNNVWTSIDGSSWSRSSTGLENSSVNSVMTGGPGLVAFGHHDDTSVVWTSPDGYVWTRVPQEPGVFTGTEMSGATVGGPGLVAVGRDELNSDRPVVWTSPNGTAWSRVPLDPSVFHEGTAITDVAAGGAGLVAVGFERRDGPIVAAVWTSPDGISWTRVPHDEAVFGGVHEDMASVAAVGDGFVAVGSWGHPNVWTSPDGWTWSRISDTTAVFSNSGGLTKVITGGPGIVVFGTLDVEEPVQDRHALDPPVFDSPLWTVWVATPTDAD